jgi:hypothetical protein
LAARTASSARRSRSVTSSRPGMPAATPMLTVRLIVWPSIVRRSCNFQTVEVDVEDGDRAGLPDGEPI